jgi:hypothetical protein
LEHAVPMDRCALIIRKLIIHLYDNSVTNVALNKRSRELILRYEKII